jgi:putative oxidoreductase
MMTHGIPKLMRLFSGNEIRFSDPFGFGPTASLALATFAEFLCSVAVLIGLGTRFAAIPLMATMLTAAFYAHADDPFGTKEKPLLFALVYFGLFMFGSGKYSIDHLITKRR